MKKKKQKKLDTIFAYLDGLSKNELRDLVIEFAPDDFKKEILAKDIPSKLNICVNEIASSMRFDIDDEELLYNPSLFQSTVSNHIKKLTPFVNSNTNEIFDILFEIAIEIEDKYENGYLYRDGYYDEEAYFEFDDFVLEVIELIGKIESGKKQAEILIEFKKVCSKSGYMKFDFKSLNSNYKKYLLPYFDEDNNMDFYLFVKKLLSFEEKEKFLLNYNSPSANLPLVDLYVTNNQIDKAVAILERLLKEKFDVEYLERLLKIKKVSTMELREWVIKVIEDANFSGLDFLLQNIKKTENPKELELLLKEKNINIYYNYLEKNNRIDEMFEILNRLYPRYKEDFFKKYKVDYKKDAEIFFKAEIEKNLKNTGNSYYRTIADLLEHLKIIMDKPSFILLVKQLKNSYKRRKNFIAILNNRFTEAIY